MNVKLSILIGSLVIKIKEAGRYTTSAFFIAIGLVTIPISLNLFLVVFLLTEGNKNLSFVGYIIPPIIMSLLLFRYKKKFIEQLSLEKRQIKMCLICYLTYLALSIFALLYGKP